MSIRQKISKTKPIYKQPSDILLRQSEERYRSLFENAPLGISHCLADGTVLRVNQALAEMSGFSSPQEMLTAINTPGVICYVNPIDRQRLMGSSNIQGNWSRMEIEFFKKDETILRTRVSSRNVLGPEGKVIYRENFFEDITERTRAEEAVRLSEERFRLMFEHMTSGLIVFEAVDHGSDFTIKDCNPAAGQITHTSASAILGKAVRQVFPGIRESGLLELFQRVYRSGASEYLPTTLYRDSRLSLWLDTRVYRLPSGEVVAVFEDVTQRVQTLSDLINEKNKFLSFLNALDLSINICDKNYNVLFENSFSIDRHGPCTGKKCYQIFEKRDSVCPGCSASLSLQDGKPHSGERRVALPDGETIIYQIFASPILEKNGEINSFIELVLDISERKQAEAALKETNEFNQALLESSLSPFLVTNPDNSIRYVNPAFEKVAGYTMEELLGCRHPFPWWPEDQVSSIIIDNIKFREEGVFGIERKYRNKNGQDFWVLVNGKPIRDEKGIKYFLANWVDITDYKRMEEELKNSHQQLHHFTSHLQDQLESERKQLSVEIHDELGQMITGLKMELTWLINKLPLEQENLKEKAKNLINMVDATDKIMRNIATSLRPTLLDDLGLVEALEWLVNQFQERNKTKCVLRIPENLNLEKNASLDVFRIIQESLTNVSRHAGASLVQITMRTTGDHLLLTIKDNGKGLTPEDLTKNHSFGLAGMRERAGRLGGFLDIQGVPGKGTTITLDFPFITRSQT